MTNSLKPDWDSASSDVIQDQRAAYDEMRERCPVAYSESMQWSLFRHQDVSHALHDYKTFSNAVSEHLSVPNGMDPPEHTHFRKIIEPYFTEARMQAFEPECRYIVDQQLQHLSKQNDMELMADFALPFAAHAQCAFMGWPQEVSVSLMDWMQKNHAAIREQDRNKLFALAREFDSIIYEQINERVKVGAKPHDDVTAALIHESVHGRQMNDEEIISILRNWTAGEVSTISAAVGILVHYLAQHQDLQARLRAQPSLVRAANDEILRIHGPLVANRRITTRPVEIGGRKIDAGEYLSLNWIAANRDGRVFDEPDTFRFDRDPKDNLLYGAGIHVCPGALLARLELQLVVEAFLKHTTEITLTSSAPVNAVYPASGFVTLPIQIS